MKTLAYILSLYILLLTLLPCIDVPISQDNHTAAMSQNGHETHQGEKDNCSPFCTCSCCATSAIFQEYLAEFNSFLFIGQNYFPVSSKFISDPLASIWQPPKIA